jgi:hypothetical protein
MTSGESSSRSPICSDWRAPYRVFDFHAVRQL